MRKRGVKGQFSMEFLIVLGFAFLMTIPLIALFYQQSDNLNKDISGSQIDKVASEIRDAADEVFYLGSPSKKTITVYIPKEVDVITIVNNTIIFAVTSSGNDYEVVKWSSANLTGSITPSVGIHHVSAESYDNYVQISD